MFFSKTHWPQLMAPFYLILFETSICRFNSSKCSPIMSDEDREHLTRDQRPFLHPESLQTLQIHRSMTVLLLFSSALSSSTGFRSENSCSSGFRSEDRNGRRRSLVLCSVTHFCVVFQVCVWIILQLEDPNTVIRFLTESVTYWFVYLLVFDRIYDAMCLNKMSRTFSRNIGPQHQKYSSIFHYTRGVLFIPVFTKPILSVHLTIEARPVWSSSHVW